MDGMVEENGTSASSGDPLAHSPGSAPHPHPIAITSVSFNSPVSILFVVVVVLINFSLIVKIVFVKFKKNESTDLMCRENHISFRYIKSKIFLLYFIL